MNVAVVQLPLDTITHLVLAMVLLGRRENGDVSQVGVPEDHY
jgi:hypothetical protein